MIPLVIKGAKTSLGIGAVAPEVQYLLSNFRNDFGLLKRKSDGGGSYGYNETYRKAQLSLVRYTVESLRGIFKLHGVNLLDVFKVRTMSVLDMDVDVENDSRGSCFRRYIAAR